MAYETITATIEHGIGRLTLNQPDKLNPLGTNTLQDIIDATTWFNKENISVVIVSGNGRAFTAGFDLREFTNTDSTGKDGAVLGREMAEAVDRMKPITIASLHGYCIGGGVVLASACDLRIASENTTFSIPEVDLGIPLAWGGIPRLVREIGPAMTKELVMTCRPFDAEEAKSLGFINRVVKDADLESQTMNMAEAIRKRPQSVIETTKNQVRAATDDLASTKNEWVGEMLIGAANKDSVARSAAQNYLNDKSGR
ncbi:MAG: enoyl-CoA hydratase [Candidatus Marinimicrobia bacterium]|jgi:enoyl-CoA hydratase/carnithine racemase|nr:enoyl-CoA hydratase [Candidatus Neomarinimicrobiota bacterium]|tara:strand:- start:1445 stop:2209 length:765 start_codon:yes stop_codon:yes gene_type:complete